MIYEFKKVMYKYGVIFYNHETEHEMRFYFYAYSAFQAEQGISKLKIDGYSKGSVIYIEERYMSDWDNASNLFTYFKKELREW